VAKAYLKRLFYTLEWTILELRPGREQKLSRPTLEDPQHHWGQCPTHASDRQGPVPPPMRTRTS